MIAGRCPPLFPNIRIDILVRVFRSSNQSSATVCTRVRGLSLTEPPFGLVRAVSGRQVTATRGGISNSRPPTYHQVSSQQQQAPAVASMPQAPAPPTPAPQLPAAQPTASGNEDEDDDYVLIAAPSPASSALRNPSSGRVSPRGSPQGSMGGSGSGSGLGGGPEGTPQQDSSVLAAGKGSATGAGSSEVVAAPEGAAAALKGTGRESTMQEFLVSAALNFLVLGGRLPKWCPERLPTLTRLT